MILLVHLFVTSIFDCSAFSLRTAVTKNYVLRLLCSWGRNPRAVVARPSFGMWRMVARTCNEQKEKGYVADVMGARSSNMMTTRRRFG